MPGETELHRTLKKEACRWLYGQGYRCVAAEVSVRPVGIIDAVGTGVFGPSKNHQGVRRSVHQTCFVECKASRSDFLRDLTRSAQMQLCLLERKTNRRARRRLRQTLGLGKFAACLLQPMANLHYVLAPSGLIQKKDLPERWGLLSWCESGIHVVVRASWQESENGGYVESAIARTLTNDIFRAGERALSSLNRELMKQQQDLAEKIRALSPVLADPVPRAVLDTTATTPLPSGIGWEDDTDEWPDPPDPVGHG